MLRRFLSFALLAGCAPLLACDSESSGDGYLDLVVQSDLGAAQLGYVRVELLGVRDGDVLQESWFTLDASCVDGAGARGLFSLSLARGKSATARVRVTGYGYDEQGVLQPRVTQRFDTEVPERRAALLVELRSICAIETVQCAPSESCLPESGRCAEVAHTKAYLHVSERPQVQDCAQAISAAPAETRDVQDAQVDALDAGTEAGGEAGLDQDASGLRHPCNTGDGVCGEGCSAAQDRDCRRAAGEACEQNENCRTDLLCVDGVCCTSSCTDECARCDLSGSAGLCTPIDYTRSDDVQNCGGCGLTCGGSQVESASCASGACQYTCAAGFGDCDQERSGSNGCEQDLRSDPDHCGGCGRVCADVTGFPYCARQNCAQASGVGALGSEYPVAAGAVVGTLVRIANGATVLALAALIRPEDLSNPGQLVLGLVEKSELGLPGKVLTQSGLIVPRDGAQQLNGKYVWTHGQVTAAQVAAGEYWLVVTGTRPFLIMSHATPKSVYREDNVGLTYFSSNDFYGDLNTSLTLSLSAVLVEN